MLKNVSYLPTYPLHDHNHGISLFLYGELSSFGDAMPFLKAASATTSGCMLGYEDRRSAMPHGRLLAIIGNICRSQSPGDYLNGMLS